MRLHLALGPRLACKEPVTYNVLSETGSFLSMHQHHRKADLPKPQVDMQPLPPADDVEVSFARSSGAGGQNVNKVNTKVDMRLHIGKADFLSEEVRESLLRLVCSVFTVQVVSIRLCCSVHDQTVSF